MKRISAVFLVIGVVLLIVTGCGKANLPETNGTVIIMGDEEILKSQVTLTGDKPTAEDAVIHACKDKKIPYTFKNGMFDHFNGVASTKTDGWILYVNDKLSDVGAKDVVLKDQFVVEFRYVNYDQAFAK